MFSKKEYVYQVYQERSFSRAADKLYISQPSLSAAVKKAENQLGQPIFDRSSLPLRLTDFGQHYIQTIEEIMRIERNFKHYLNDINQLRTGQLSIGSTHLYTSYFLSRLMTGFVSRYPAIKTTVIESNSVELEQRLAKGELDLMMDNIQLDSRLFTAHPFVDEQLLLVVPKNNPLNQKFASCCLTAEDIVNQKHYQKRVDAVPLTAFRRERFVLMTKGNNTRRHSDLLFEHFGFRPLILFELEQLATIFHFVATGLACSIVNDIGIRLMSEQGRYLCYYKIKAPATERKVYVYHKRNHYVSHAMRAFLEELSEDVD